MDDLIVIILTLIIILAGVVGQLKKKPPKNNNNGDDQPINEDDLWSLPGEREDIRIQPETIPKEDKQFKQQPNHKKPHYKNEVASIYSKELTKKEKLKKYEKTGGKSKFPIRKAIIYSEIINRKYT